MTSRQENIRSPRAEQDPQRERVSRKVSFAGVTREGGGVAVDGFGERGAGLES